MSQESNKKFGFLETMRINLTMQRDRSKLQKRNNVEEVFYQL